MTSTPAPLALPMEDRFAILSGLRNGYDRMLDQFVDDFIDSFADVATPEEAEARYRRFVSSQKLLRRRWYDLPFSAFVIEQVLQRDDLKVVRARLLRGVLASIVLKGRLRRAILERPASERKARIGRASTARARDLRIEPESVVKFLREYGAVFAPEPGGPDQRARYSTVFDHGRRPEGDGAPTEAEFAEFMSHELRLELLDYPAHYLASYVADLEAFLEEWQRALATLAAEEDADLARIGFLQSQVPPVAPLPILLHNAIFDIVCLHWMMDGRRNDLEVLQALPALEMDRTTAMTLRDSYRRLLPPASARQAVEAAGFWHKRWGCPQGAVALWRLALDDSALLPAERAALHSSIGMVYRDQPKPKLAVKEFLAAAQLLRGAGDVYGLGIALKNLGEVRALGNHPRPAEEAYQEAIRVAAGLPDAPKRDLLWNLALSLRRAGFRNMEREALEAFIRAHPEDVDQVIYTNVRLDELAGRRVNEIPAPFLVDPKTATSDELRRFDPPVSERTLLDEVVPGADSSFEAFLDEIQPILEKPFRPFPGAGFGFRHIQEPAPAHEYSRVVLCFEQAWVKEATELADARGFGIDLLLAEVTQIVTHARLALLDAYQDAPERAEDGFEDALRATLARSLDGLFGSFRVGESRPFYLFHVMSVEDSREDVLYHFFGIRFEDGRPLEAVHGRRAQRAPAWYPVYWQSDAAAAIPTAPKEDVA